MLVAGESVWLACAAYAYLRGQMQGVVLALGLPLHVALMLVFLRSNSLLLRFFVAVYPLTVFELLPHGYRDFGLYGGVLVLVAVLAAIEGSGATGGPASGDRGIAIALWTVAVMIFVAGVHAAAVGNMSAPIARYSVAALLTVLCIAVFGSVPRSAGEVQSLLLVLAYVTAAASLVLPIIAGHTLSKVFVTPFGDGNLNLVGMVVGPLCALLFGLLFGSKPEKPVRVIAAAAVLVTILIFSRSRGAWVGFVLAYLYLMLRLKSRGLMIVGVCVAGLVLSSDLLRLSVVARAEQTSLEDPSFLGRLFLWRVAASAFSRNWLLGMGVEAFRFHKYDYGFPKVMDPLTWHGSHNLFLEQFLSLGVIGGAAFICIAVKTFLGTDRVARSRSGPERGLAVGLCAAIIAYGAHCMIDSPGWHAPTLMLWGILLGSAYAVWRQYRVPSVSVTAGPSIRSAVIGGRGSVVAADRLAGS